MKRYSQTVANAVTVLASLGAEALKEGDETAARSIFSSAVMLLEKAKLHIEVEELAGRLKRERQEAIIDGHAFERAEQFLETTIPDDFPW